MLLLTVRAPAVGRVTVSGRDLGRASRRLRRAGTVTLSLPLKGAGAATLRRHGRVRIKLRVAFKPVTGRPSSASPTLTLR